MLWRGRKFHFRVYALLRADMSAWLYRTAYILSASRPYSLGREKDDGRAGAVAEGDGVRREGFADELVHISNLAVNKHTEGHPGQVSCDCSRQAARSLAFCMPYSACRAPYLQLVSLDLESAVLYAFVVLFWAV